MIIRNVNGTGIVNDDDDDDEAKKAPWRVTLTSQRGTLSLTDTN